MIFAGGRRAASAALLAALVLGGCHPAQVIDTREASRIKTIGVVSAVGDTFRMSEVSVIRYPHHVSDTAIPEWGIDAEATSQVQKILERYGYKVVSLHTLRHAEITGALIPTFGHEPDRTAMRRILTEEQPGAKVDAFLVLAKAHGREPCSMSTPPPAYVRGLGICAGPRVQMSSAMPDGETRDVEGPYGNRMLAPFASYQMALLRASDFEVLANRAAAIRRSERNMLGLPRPTSAVPYQQIHAAAYKASFGEFTEDEKRAIRKVIIELLETTIPDTLRTMGLISH
jgi:hypothetical protein